MAAIRRSRLLRFLAPWTAPSGGYEVRVGPTRFSAEVLSDDALEDLASRVVADFWSRRRRVGLNRPLYAAAALRDGHRLSPEAMRFTATVIRMPRPIAFWSLGAGHPFVLARATVGQGRFRQSAEV